MRQIKDRPGQPIEPFIARWQGREGGQERANYVMFLNEFCQTLGLPMPEPAGATTRDNDYVFERAVKDFLPDGSAASRRIDLYKRGCFVLEAKQSRLKGHAKAPSFRPSLFPATEPDRPGTRTADRGSDVLMRNARSQAEGYARALPVDHGWPPFVLVCDVGHVLEVYADFSGQGKNYAQFPDRQSFRIYLEDLRRPEIRDRLVAIWTDPLSLDPARASARATRAIAERLAAVSKALEKQGHDPERVAMFLMRCLFTMFASDVELLPRHAFRDVLIHCETHPENLPHKVGQLWEAMDTGNFAHALNMQVRRFNGEFFKDRSVIALRREEIAELRHAAEADWSEVDPSILGALLEQALDAKERRRLGAHYTPRAYVDRLVIATVMEPLRNDWNAALSTASRQRAADRPQDAVKTILSFHHQLCGTHILDPACGTGNFLYVSLELLKRLEGEVLEALADLGGRCAACKAIPSIRISSWASRSTPEPRRSPNWCCGSAICNGISAPRAACPTNPFCGRSIISRSRTRSCGPILSSPAPQRARPKRAVTPTARPSKFTPTRTPGERTGRRRILSSAIPPSSAARTCAPGSARSRRRPFGVPMRT